jgi:hypothetical protein
MAVTMTNAVFRYIKYPVHTSQETHYVSATEPSWLMLRKIWGFHGGDYDECSLFGHENLIHTSQETQYVTATEPSRLLLCKIWGFHGSDYEEYRLLGWMPCDSCKNRRFGGTYRPQHQSDKNQRAMIPRKRWFLEEPHGEASQKTAFFDA